MPALIVESLCIGKQPSHPDLCEDRVVSALPYAVAIVDGATDIHGYRYDGRAPGWLAADIVARCIGDNAERMVTEAWSDDAVYSEIDRYFEVAYRHFGLFDLAYADPKRRFRSALVLARATADGLRIIGDLSLVRIDGRRLASPANDLEALFIALRCALWNDPSMAELDEDGRDAAVGTLLRAGIAPTGSTADIRARLEIVLRREPCFPVETVDAALDFGLRGGRDARDDRSPLYSMAIDGFSHENPPQPGITIPWGHFSTVEIFSDGYPGQPSGATLADWETLVEAANREDPRRLGRFAAVKGVVPGGSHDDRSLIIVRNWVRPRI